MLTSIIPKAMLNSISPLAVSKAMAVVRIRVKPWMLPPSIIATPNSAKALLNPAMMASVTPPEASWRMAVDAWTSVDPRVLARSLSSRLIDSIALVMKLTMIGVIRIDCPIAMASGVKSSPNMPRGPDLERRRNSTSPSTTVGIPRKALKVARMKRLPGIFFKPRTTAIGRLQRVAIAVASPDMYRLRKTMLYSTGSNESNSCKALMIPSAIVLVKTESPV